MAGNLSVALEKLPAVCKRIDAFCSGWRNARENVNYEADSNGERWLLRTLAKNNLLGRVFDVGASRGNWTAMVLKLNPSAVSHCFEICSPTFQKLSSRFVQDQRVILNDFGLSASEEDIRVNYCPTETLSSMFEVVCSQNVQVMNAHVVCGRDYCAKQNITSIDLLKIDVEGAEHLVLQGFGDMLNPEQIPIVQFEYGMVNIATKYLLKDFHAYFESRGYLVGKLFPKRVRFRKYRFEDEDFKGPNFVAASHKIAPLLTLANSHCNIYGP